jgi:hypothetical protein
MAILAFAKAAVHHARRAQERHVPLVQTCQRPSSQFRLRRMRYPCRLTPCRRIGQQIFQLIERKPAILELGRRTRRDRIVAVGDVIRQRRNLVVPPCQVIELPIRLAHGVVVHTLAFLARAPDTEYDGLLVRNGVGFGEPIYGLIFELQRQNRSAVVDAIIRHDHNEHSARSNPPRQVLQKEPLHSLVFPFANFKVVGWIEI